MKRKECESMDMEDFSKYLKYKSFNEAVHHVRRISMERTNVFRPLSAFDGLKQNETAWLILCSRPEKKSPDSLIGTLTKEEAWEMPELTDREFSNIEGQWQTGS